MHASSKHVRAAGLIAAAVLVAACQTPGGTAAPTLPSLTNLPIPSALPSLPASMGIPSGAIVTFTPTAGASTQLQGGATLVELNGKTQVGIALTNAGTETYAAAIQAGTCGSLTPEIAHRLTDVASGVSVTEVDVDVETLLATDYAINIIVLGSETESSLACGNIEQVIQ
jgi:hypothetical protein